MVCKFEIRRNKLNLKYRKPPPNSRTQKFKCISRMKARACSPCTQSKASPSENSKKCHPNLKVTWEVNNRCRNLVVGKVCGQHLHRKGASVSSRTSNQIKGYKARCLRRVGRPPPPACRWDPERAEKNWTHTSMKSCSIFLTQQRPQFMVMVMT